MGTELERAQWAKRRRDTAERLAEAIRVYKVSKGCIDCGYNAHHAGLDFDHIPDRGEKSMGVAVLAGKGKVTKTWEEIAKCEVVCKTCHGIRTWNRQR